MWLKTIKGSLINLDKIETVVPINKATSMILYADFGNSKMEICECKTKIQAEKIMNNIFECMRANISVLDVSTLKGLYEEEKIGR